MKNIPYYQFNIEKLDNNNATSHMELTTVCLG